MVVLDVDGTLVDSSGIARGSLSVFQMALAVRALMPLPEALATVPALAGHDVLVLTDRLASMRHATQEWVARTLGMRVNDWIFRAPGEPSGARRKSAIVERLAKRGPVLWIDDDPAIVAPSGVRLFRAPHEWERLRAAL